MQNVTSWRRVRAIAMAVIVATAAGSAGAAEGWRWSLTPYMWATDVSETLLLDGSQVGGDDTEFSDLVDKLDTSLQLHFEGVRERWGLFADVTYFELSDLAEGELGFGAKRQSAVLAGYRYRELEYGRANVLDVEKTLSGFVLGLKIGF